MGCSLGIGDCRILRLLYMLNSLANVQQLMTIFTQMWASFKNSSVTLHLSPATKKTPEFNLTNIQKRYLGLSLRNIGQEIPPGYYQLGPQLLSQETKGKQSHKGSLPFKFPSC